MTFGRGVVVVSHDDRDYLEGFMKLGLRLPQSWGSTCNTAWSKQPERPKQPGRTYERLLLS